MDMDKESDWTAVSFNLIEIVCQNSTCRRFHTRVEIFMRKHTEVSQHLSREKYVYHTQHRSHAAFWRTFFMFLFCWIRTLRWFEFRLYSLRTKDLNVCLWVGCASGLKYIPSFSLVSIVLQVMVWQHDAVNDYWTTAGNCRCVEWRLSADDMRPGSHDIGVCGSRIGK